MLSYIWGGMHLYLSLKGVWLVSLILCLIRAVLPRSRSLHANKCSHLSNNSLACFCSDSGHSFRPWRSRASKTQPLGVFIVVSSVVLVRWTTSGTWLAGITWPNTILAGISMAQALILHKQIGTLEEPGCSSPYVAMGTTAAGNWGPSAGSMRTCTFMQCPLTPAFPFIVIVWKGGIVTFCVVQTAPLTPSNWSSSPPQGHSPQITFALLISLSCCRIAAAILT